MPFDEGSSAKAELFKECLFSDQSKALIHAFFGERVVAKIPGLPKDVAPIPIRRAAVVGAGTMGGGITMSYANAGIPVLLKEASQELLDKGLATIRKNYAAAVQKGQLTQQQMDERLARIEPTLTYERFKRGRHRRRSGLRGHGAQEEGLRASSTRSTRPDAILASNTSTLDIDAIASATSRAAAGDRPSLLQPRQRHAPARNRARQAAPARP